MKYRIKNNKVFLFNIEDNVTKMEVGDTTDSYVDILNSEYLTEKEFYSLFIYIRQCIAKIKNLDYADYITHVNIEYLATIMCKPLEYNLPVKGRTSSQVDLAEELGRNPQSAYNAIYRLKKAGYLIATEDNLIVPNHELQTLRKVTKAHLEKLGVLPVSYLLNILVK